MMNMYAIILKVSDKSLLVRDRRTKQEVVVHTCGECDFRAGDRVRILFNGAMTLSIPPQIGAIRIIKAPLTRRCI